jgi:hypothetical protein
MEVIILSDCGHGQSHSGDIEQEFKPGTVSKSGKSTTLYKRLLLRKSRLRLPVSDHVPILTCSLADTCCYRKSSNTINAHKALHDVYRATGTSPLPEVYLACPLVLVGTQDQMLSKVNILSEWSGRDEGKTES